MSIRRSDTRRVTRSNTTRKQKKTIDDVQQGIKVLYPPDGSDIVPDVDIVFVPGLGADPLKSWKSNTNDFNWASDKDGLVRDFPRARILLYQYESAWSGPLKVKQYMGNLGSTLLHGLKGKREAVGKRDAGPPRPIIFIGHSMGGLVIAKAITIADSRRDLFPAMFESIAGCIFFGTPFGGAPPAAVASLFASIGEKFDQATSSKLLDLMKPGDEGLRELKNEFARLVGKLSQKIELFCFWEERKTDFAKLAGLPSVFKAAIPKSVAEFVNRDSATLPGVDDMGLGCIHRDLVKFDGPKDERYQLVRNPIKRIIHGAQLVVKNRLNSTRNINHEIITDVKDALEGAQIHKKRKTLGTKYAASSWLTKEQEYRDWLSIARDIDPASPIDTKMRSRDCLWIRGPEGRGKTNNMIAALEEIEKTIMIETETPTSQAPILLAYFFCEPAADYCTAEDLLKSLLWQLVKQQEMLASYAKHFIKKKCKEDNSKSTPQLTVENMWQVLQDMLSDEFIGSGVYFVINNMHVLPEDADATINLMRLVNAELTSMDIQNPKRVPIRWLFTSRNTHSVGEALKAQCVRLIDLEDEKYGNQVQLELRKHAHTEVSALSIEKKYNKAAAYFASSLIGRRAQNTQWIDIACVHLKEIPENENELTVRQILEAMPQDLTLLLERAWMQVFNSNDQSVEKIKEILRALVLTYEDPTEPELAVLAGLYQKEEEKTELRQLVEKCKPLLVVKRTSQTEVRICFMSVVVKTHLLENATKLLGLSKEATSWHHGVLCLRSFSHLMERLDFPEPEKKDPEPVEAVEGNEDDGENDDSDDDSDDGDDGDDGEDGDEDDEEMEEWSDDESDWSEDDSDVMDAEAENTKDKALAYTVKHWLHHASKATVEIAENLSYEEEFWKPGSLIRRRWLIEYARLTRSYDEIGPDRNLTALHIAASVGFTQLVAALIRNGHQDEINVRDELVNTPLHFAAYFGRVNIVEELLNKGAIIDDGIQDGDDTPLHMAALHGNSAVMSKLIRRGANINAHSPNDTGTVVNAAIYSGNREAIKLLVEKGAALTSVTTEEENFDGPLALAAQLSDLAMFEYLIEACADKLPPQEYDKAFVAAAEAGRIEVFNKLFAYNHPQECFQEALGQAAEEENWDIVMILLKRCQGLDCESTFEKAAETTENQDKVLEAIWHHTKGVLSQETLDEALHDAAGCGKQSTIELLLDKFGANPNAGDEDCGTALTEAAYLGDINIVKVLLDRGAKVNSPEGWALQTAAAEGHLVVVEELLRNAADVNACTTNENFPAGTALQAACEAGKLEIVELLLQHNANPNFGAGPHTCPLIAATERGEDRIVELLVNAKADVNVSGGLDLSTPLVNAAAFLTKESLELLLISEADINLPDTKKGDTALIVAAARGDEDCVQLLLDKGADIMHSNEEGVNAIQSAVANMNFECLELLINRVSMILSAIKTAMDSGNSAVTKVVRSVGVSQQTTNSDEPTIIFGNERTGSDASFAANDEQNHYKGTPGSGLRDWEYRENESMKINNNADEGLSPAQENGSNMSFSLYDSYLEETSMDLEHNGIHTEALEARSKSQESISSIPIAQPTPRLARQPDYLFEDLAPSPSQMKIKRKPPPGSLNSGQSSLTPSPGLSEYPGIYQSGAPTPPPKENSPSNNSSSPYQTTEPHYQRSNPNSATPQQQSTGSNYQTSHWYPEQNIYQSPPPLQKPAYYPSPPPEQHTPQRKYAPYNPDSYSSKGTKEEQYRPIYQQDWNPGPGQNQPNGGYKPNNLYEGDGYGGAEMDNRRELKGRKSLFNMKFGK